MSQYSIPPARYAAEQTKAPTIKPMAVRINDAVRISGFSRSRLYEMAGRGDVVFLKCGRAVLVDYASLENAVRSLPRATIRIAA